jgi:hypothetical protein
MLGFRGHLTISLLLAVVGCAPSAPMQAAASDPSAIQIDGGSIHVEISEKPPQVQDESLHLWIQTAARAVSGYYHRFPTRHLDLLISLGGHGHDISGQTYGSGRIEIQLAREVTPDDLHDDWVLTHEMFHLAFPDLRESHLWMNEGLSTYLEPIARARIGNLAVAKVWKQMVENFPEGQPERGDRGLDYTHTWGRTYWGGCMFWLLADLEIRQQTHNRKSLDDGLRAILDAGGDGSASWPMARVLQTADQATGTAVLQTLYDQMALHPHPVDLPKLWNDLGVRVVNDRTVFDDSAPLAAIRRSITQS